MSIQINVTLGGGLESLFQSKEHSISLNKEDPTKEITVKNLLYYMLNNLLVQRPEYFMENGDLRPGILVLINDTDWELLGRMDATLQENDNVMIITTLHGG